MIVKPLPNCPDVKLIVPEVFRDDRGEFFESWNEAALASHGIDVRFVQDNQSRSATNVLRGLHYQTGDHAQGKLVRAAQGEIWDVVVDLRPGSMRLKWDSVFLGGMTHKMLWIPPGFAHGFQVTHGPAIVVYKCTKYRHEPAERVLRWDDPAINITWPSNPHLSDKDANAPFIEVL